MSTRALAPGQIVVGVLLKLDGCSVHSLPCGTGQALSIAKLSHVCSLASALFDHTPIKHGCMVVFVVSVHFATASKGFFCQLSWV